MKEGITQKNFEDIVFFKGLKICSEGKSG